MQLVPVTQMLKAAEKGGYGIGFFSARNTYLIDAVLKGAQETKAPVIVQISANEFNWFDVTAKEFADRFYEVHGRYQGQAALHLDHTKDMDIIKAAIDAGFQSVMIDASQKSFEDNIAITREVVEYAHAKNVEVEAELGKIGATDKIETDNDESLYTDPAEAEEFVAKTGVDTLAVSIGTAHGVSGKKSENRSGTPCTDQETGEHSPRASRRQWPSSRNGSGGHHHSRRRREQNQHCHGFGAGLFRLSRLSEKDQPGNLADG